MMKNYIVTGEISMVKIEKEDEASLQFLSWVSFSLGVYNTTNWYQRRKKRERNIHEGENNDVFWTI